MNVVEMLKQIQNKLGTITHEEETDYIRGIKDLFYVFNNADGSGERFSILMYRIETELHNKKEVDNYTITVVRKPFKLALMDFVQNNFADYTKKDNYNKVMMGIIDAVITDIDSMKEAIHEVLTTVYKYEELDTEIDIKDRELTDTVGNKALTFDITVTY